MGQESETVDRIQGQKGQPEVEGETCQGGKVYPFPAIGLFIGPAEEGWEEGDKEYEPIETQNDNQDFGIGLDVVAEAARAAAQNVSLENVHLEKQRSILSITFGYG